MFQAQGRRVEPQRGDPADRPARDHRVHRRPQAPLAPRHRAQRQHDRRGRHARRRRATLADEGVVSYWAIAVAIVIGSVIGVVSARAVKMTAMPQMVALFNGVGGGGGGADRARRVPPPRAEPGRAAARRVDRDRALARDRLHLVRRLADRLREAAGADRRAPDHLSRPEGRQRR